MYDAVRAIAKRGTDEPGNLGEIFSAYRNNGHSLTAFDLAGALKDAAKSGSLEERLEIALSEEKLYGSKEAAAAATAEERELMSTFTENMKQAAKNSPEIAKLVLAIGAKAPNERGSMKQYFDAYKADPKIDMSKFLAAAVAHNHAQEKNGAENVRQGAKDLDVNSANKSSLVK